jgi:hypothetical protein
MNWSDQDKAAIQALMDRDGVNIAQATVEIEGVNSGDRFVIRGSCHPKHPVVKARSWTRATLASASVVADAVRGQGYEEVHVYYCTSDGYLV